MSIALSIPPRANSDIEQDIIKTIKSHFTIKREKYEAIAEIVSQIAKPLIIMDSLCRSIVRKGHGKTFAEGIKQVPDKQLKNQFLFTLAKEMSLWGDFKTANKISAYIEGPLQESAHNWIQTCSNGDY